MLSGTCGNGGIWDLSRFYGSLSSGRAVMGWGEGADELGSSQGNTGMTFWGFWLECGQALASEGEGVSKHDLL